MISRQQTRQAILKLGTLVGLVVLWCLPAVAGTPVYTKLKLAPGQGVEIKGQMSAAGFFVAADIEMLAQPRRPKLRGSITSWDRQNARLEMFGQVISLTETTEFATGNRSDLAEGKRASVSCGIDKQNGRWIARTITTSDVKASDKIKGTITEMWVDGVAPDTLSLAGLLVILNEETDVATTLLIQDKRQRKMFGRLQYDDANSLTKGHALADGKMGLRVKYRQYLRDEKQHDLADIYDSNEIQTQPELKARWFGFFNEDFRAMADFRVRRKYYVASDLDIQHEDWEFQMRQAYVLWRNIADQNVALTVGRQKIKEKREWLWDEYLEAVRLFVYGSDHFGLQATYIKPVNPLKDKFETWTDAHLAVEYHLNEDTSVSLYWLRRWDSDEGRNREPVWWGGTYRGRPLKPVLAWGDLTMMRGTDKGRDLQAWAMDFGATWYVRRSGWRPTLTVDYAFGSGDQPGTDGVDGEFRQTGYQDNATRFGGVTSVRYYGALLDPELSNLSIATVGAGVRPGADWSVDVFYHRYQQDWAEDDLRGSLVDPPARPNGAKSDIGWELDVVLGVRNVWGRVKVSWTVGLFQPGEAYFPRRETAVLNKINFSVEI